VSVLGSAMSSADLATVMITCPHCGTRYQVPFSTIGSDGREVQCAQCSKSWHATAQAVPPPAVDPDLLFPKDEAALDFAFETEEKAVAPATFPHSAPVPADPDHERTLAEIRAAIAPKSRRGPANAIDPKTLSKAKESFDRRQKSVVGKLPHSGLAVRPIVTRPVYGLTAVSRGSREDEFARRYMRCRRSRNSETSPSPTRSAASLRHHIVR